MQVSSNVLCQFKQLRTKLDKDPSQNGCPVVFVYKEDSTRLCLFLSLFRTADYCHSSGGTFYMLCPATYRNWIPNVGLRAGLPQSILVHSSPL